MKAKLVAVNSSAILSVAYNEKKQTMHLVFVSGVRYVYANVPFIVVMQLLAAPSIGRFFNAVIRPSYSYKRKG
jgi:hypothetical protein